MIRLKHILNELAESEINRLTDKINNKQFKFFDKGDNGRIYSIDDEDKLFKITTESEEYKVADIIVGRSQQFNTFIPVHYVNGKNMYIMSKADPISRNEINEINNFLNGFKQYAREQGGEVSIFDYLDADGARENNEQLVNFLRALQQDIQRIGLLDLDLDLDFKSDNIMRWNGNMVMIDW
tara:strand:- start:557 stop:1099 length:543 start_codon:yes stop_codon:yes gene_type:complete